MGMFKQIAILTACSLLAACGKEKAPQVAKPPVAVETAAAAPMNLVEAVEVTGSLEPKFSADVKTQIPGLVKQVHVTEWVRVKKGTPLARIDIAETEALVKRGEAAVESAKAGQIQSQVALNRSEREQARVQKLKESGLATQQALDDAHTETEAARARLDASRAQIRVAEEDLRQARARLAKGVVTSPMDGVVGMRDVNVGDLASDAAAGKPIFRIVDNRLLNLTVTVPSVDSARVKVGQQLEFSVDSLPGKTFTGRVMFINPELSAADRSLKVIAEVNNPGELLKGGLFAKGRIITGTRSSVLQVPRSAVAGLDVTAGSGTVFVVTAGTVQKRAVRVGAANGEMLEIVEGLKPGEEYVTRGGFNLKDGDRVSVAKGGAPAAVPTKKETEK
ncbi:MAG TPA: efflux RND transporter periplasmic adaptor subunit [Geobacteraceae bacterium]|nr:efflux RND transporter periplasmic adaptor subunit [Geobacteraceae bacterium]